MEPDEDKEHIFYVPLSSESIGKKIETISLEFRIDSYHLAIIYRHRQRYWQ